MFHQLDLETKLSLYKITKLSQLLCVVHWLVCRKMGLFKAAIVFLRDALKLHLIAALQLILWCLFLQFLCIMPGTCWLDVGDNLLDAFSWNFLKIYFALFLHTNRCTTQSNWLKNFLMVHFLQKIFYPTVVYAMVYSRETKCVKMYQFVRT